MITTPICDFVRAYAASGSARLHMPGHKGVPALGCEPLDITEISGADDLYHARGIIAESEGNASRLFGCPTYYSTEGSSLCIRAMLRLAAAGGGEHPLILAGRNAHKTLIYSAVLLDLEIQWMYPEKADSYHACPLTGADVAAALRQAKRKPCAVYLTSPDYLGNMADIEEIAAVCHAHGVLLLVDNAHGAYLRFLSPSRHPMDLGADLCCDSAHKTLPVLTGGAYLHVSEKLSISAEQVKDAMGLFGSTSPSYLIMQSLDFANPYLENLPQRLAEFLPRAAALRAALEGCGYRLVGDEPMKLTLDAASVGYSGEELASILEARGILCEFSDPDFLVLMLTPENSDGDLQRLFEVLSAVPGRESRVRQPMPPHQPEQVMTARAACFALREVLPVDQCLGRILASPTVSCPPAIPIVMCGERIDREAIKLFRTYGIDTCCVVKE